MSKWTGGFSPRWDFLLGEEEAYGANPGSSGSAQTLPMSEEEKAAVKKRPLGFILPEAPKRRRKQA